MTRGIHLFILGTLSKRNDRYPMLNLILSQYTFIIVSIKKKIYYLRESFS